MKTCSKCGEEKALQDFYAHPRTKDGRGSQCKVCQLGTSNQRTFEQRRDQLMRREYGITLAVYESMYQAQEGCCKVCGKEEPQLVVDHDHDTRAVRGLLCNNCNLGLGHFKDDADRLRSAIKYLEG